MLLSGLSEQGCVCFPKRRSNLKSIQAHYKGLAPSSKQSDQLPTTITSGHCSPQSLRAGYESLVYQIARDLIYHQSQASNVTQRWQAVCIENIPKHRRHPGASGPLAMPTRGCFLQERYSLPILFYSCFATRWPPTTPSWLSCLVFRAPFQALPFAPRHEHQYPHYISTAVWFVCYLLFRPLVAVLPTSFAFMIPA